MAIRILKHLFDPRGRSGRLEYFLHSFAEVVWILGFAFLADSFLLNEDASFIVLMVGVVLGGITELICTIRRLHDLGMSAWGVLGLIIPIYSFILTIRLLFEAGEQGTNAYGPPPGTKQESGPDRFEGEPSLLDKPDKVSQFNRDQ
ncbi:MAG: DUF805 domain-containing protein [Verrucomicrobiota bacterium]